MLTPNITLQIVSSQKKIVCSLQTRSRALISDPTVARDRQSEGGSDLVFFFLLAPTNPSSSPSGSRRGSSSSSPAIRGYFSPWWDREISRREERLAGEEMITRAKLVEQLRDHQIRSAQSYSAALAVFLPSPHIASRSASHQPAHVRFPIRCAWLLT